MRQAVYFLYECADCGEKTFVGPEGGALNPCDCAEDHETLVTPLYDYGDGVLPPKTPLSALAGKVAA